MAGASPETIAALKSKQPAQDLDFEVWPENWEYFVFFTKLSTQWKFVSSMEFIQRTGLDYCAVEAVMNMQALPRKSRAEVLEAIQVMELAALAVFNKPQAD